MFNKSYPSYVEWIPWSNNLFTLHTMNTFYIVFLMNNINCTKIKKKIKYDVYLKIDVMI